MQDVKVTPKASHSEMWFWSWSTCTCSKSELPSENLVEHEMPPNLA